ncbi:hypothetical protein SLNWT_1840 [Streptomyces albus]|uniref:Uncharacterized protein n=1 Tax=Streptomyces albus (strain ATCC 21838 / DSM 41398 / FERM P-419 / JCM 4703 / NBRC 107858) TaxID=1081613 RepID=A0A0B5EU20_STRA4|nr:hypothetical protein SLNWT_1840 [Streptomyces albus]AOU76533.1 hypothetical protein SLNHY_1842 [Streptomyces albus]AYN32316.1 hypothetical protein DUI70_1813 [Streptomyces albus]
MSTRSDRHGPAGGRHSAYVRTAPTRSPSTHPATTEEGRP